MSRKNKKTNLMKNLITLLLIIISTNLFSQVEKPITKGNFLIGGSASGGYYSQKNTYSSSTTVNSISTSNDISASLSTSLGYFLLDGLAVGLSFYVSIDKGLDKYKYSAFGVGTGPFVKYYTPTGLFVGGRIGYSTSNAKYDSTSNSNYTSFYFNPEVGYAYFISSKIAIEAALNYAYDFSKSSYENQSSYSYSKYNRLYFSINLQIFL
jgi:hypothetical protein